MEGERVILEGAGQGKDKSVKCVDEKAKRMMKGREEDVKEGK